MNGLLMWLASVNPSAAFPFVVIFIILGIFSLIALAFAAVNIIALWKILEKAGQPGWAAIVPFYGSYKLYQITWGEGWYFLFTMIPVADLVFTILTMLKLSKAFGKSTGFSVGLILLSTIFMLILAFDKSQYNGIPQDFSF